MRLIEIKNIHDGTLYERFMEMPDDMLEEGAKELFAAGKKKLGDAAEKLKGAADAPAQKAWAEIQSRLATAGKEGAIGKLKDFASKNKVAIGTLAILGAGMMFSGDASASDMVGQAAGFAGQAADAAGSGGDLLQSALADIQQMGTQQGMDLSNIGNNLQGIEINGMSIQDYADAAGNAIDNATSTDPSKAQRMTDAANDNIKQAIIDAVKSSGGAQGGEQVADAAGAGGNQAPKPGNIQMPGTDEQGDFRGSSGRKVNATQSGMDELIRRSKGG